MFAWYKRFWNSAALNSRGTFDFFSVFERSPMGVLEGNLERQGREAAKAFLREHRDVTLELDGKLRQMLGLVKPDPAAANVKAK